MNVKLLITYTKRVGIGFTYLDFSKYLVVRAVFLLCLMYWYIYVNNEVQATHT